MVKTIIYLPLLLTILVYACGDKENEKVEENLEPVFQADTAEILTEPDTSLLAEEQQRIQQEPIHVVESEDGKFTVQVSSWRTRRSAERDAQRFINRGYDAYIQRVYLADRNETWFRVRIGRFKSKQEGVQFAAELAELLESGYWLDTYRAEK